MNKKKMSSGRCLLLLKSSVVNYRQDVTIKMKQLIV